MSTEQVVLALDVGGTNLNGAVVEANGRTRIVETVAAGPGGEELLTRVRRLARSLLHAATRAGATVVGVGVVAPGILDPEAGVVVYASSLNWTDVPLGPLLAADLGLPVALGHDVRHFGITEHLFGASAGAADSVLVALGTGVAACIVSRGEVVTGARGSAGELGHVPVIHDGEACTCGQYGCLEVYMSGAGLARRYRRLGGRQDLTAADIAARLATDPTAAQVWSDGIQALGLGLAAVTLLLDPSVVVLTGGVSRAGQVLLEPLRRAIADALAWRAAPALALSELGTDGGRIGASMLGFRAAGLPKVPSGWTRADVMGQASRPSPLAPTA